MQLKQRKCSTQLLNRIKVKSKNITGEFEGSGEFEEFEEFERVEGVEGVGEFGELEVCLLQEGV